MTKKPFWMTTGFWMALTVSWAVNWILFSILMIYLGHSMEWYLVLITIHMYIALISVAIWSRSKNR